jgi:hypothetical protein
MFLTLLWAQEHNTEKNSKIPNETVLKFFQVYGWIMLIYLCNQKLTFQDFWPNTNI